MAYKKRLFAFILLVVLIGIFLFWFYNGTGTGLAIEDSTDLNPESGRVSGICIDYDGDGYGIDDVSGCRYLEVDCNDADAGVNPGAFDLCGDGLDTDCDGKDAFCEEIAERTIKAREIRVAGEKLPLHPLFTDEWNFYVHGQVRPWTMTQGCAQEKGIASINIDMAYRHIDSGRIFERKYVLYDDGLHDDKEAGDGVFANHLLIEDIFPFGEYVLDRVSSTVEGCGSQFSSGHRFKIINAISGECKEFTPGLNDINDPDRINLVFLGVNLEDKEGRPDWRTFFRSVNFGLNWDQGRHRNNYYSAGEFSDNGQAFFNQPPMEGNKDRFNVWYADPMYSGAEDREIKDTKLFEEYMMARCSFQNSVFIVYDPRIERASTGFMVFMGTRDFRNGVLAHELGHRIAGLKDEYAENARCVGSSEIPAADEFGTQIAKNIYKASVNTNSESKCEQYSDWHYLVGGCFRDDRFYDECPAISDERISCSHGALFCDARGYFWRPAERTLMKTLGKDFSVVDISAFCEEYGSFFGESMSVCNGLCVEGCQQGYKCQSGECVLVDAGCPDSDRDEICDDVDNCKFNSNFNQKDLDDDGIGDVCDGDADGDGDFKIRDCDDLDKQRFHGNKEICDDGIDQDCSGVDLKCPLNCEDKDGDGYGRNCPLGNDCDDKNKDINPDALEICDGKDNNCDGRVDENVVRACGISTGLCEQGEERCVNGLWSGVCEGGTGPVREEGRLCSDGLDNDCDLINDFCDCKPERVRWEKDVVQSGEDVRMLYDIDWSKCGHFQFFDMKAFQKGSDEILLGSQFLSSRFDTYPSFSVGPWIDCNEITKICKSGQYVFTINKFQHTEPEPGDIIFSDSLTVLSEFDEDGDSYLKQQHIPAAFDLSVYDCDDKNKDINPDALEICDGKDNNCDGRVDEGVGRIFYRDFDGDGFGGTSARLSCVKPGGYVENSLDCNDRNKDVKPGARELCDFADNQCEGDIGYGSIDEGCSCSDLGGKICSEGNVCPGKAIIGDGSLENCCDVECKLPTWDNCFECGGGLFDLNLCDRDECLRVKEGCYFLDEPVLRPNICNTCMGVTSCDAYAFDEQSCESDVCGIGNCVFDNGLCSDCEDSDLDRICRDEDNCPDISNPNQEDCDGDGIGDACDSNSACSADSDRDGVKDDKDNCVNIVNPEQEDFDKDRIGDVCDACPRDRDNDIDEDGVCGDIDNCIEKSNSNQIDSDRDGVGNVCDVCPRDRDNDKDGDSICGDIDNCINKVNPDQKDCDNDGIGDACDSNSACSADSDGDGIKDDRDNCVSRANVNQEDKDRDGAGDICDICPDDSNNDIDKDGICGDVDNCVSVPNSYQLNRDGDLFGDACDVCPNDRANDGDGDGICGDVDNCAIDNNPKQEDCDGDGIGDACDDRSLCSADSDGDGIFDNRDNCINIINSNQEDFDSDGIGDACDVCENDADNDKDGDGICGDVDNCVSVPNNDQNNLDGDSFGNVCDVCPRDRDNDKDGDSICGDIDICRDVYDPQQNDCDGDGIGDACDSNSACSADSDRDGVNDNIDNCIDDKNSGQEDSDRDGIGNVCDACPNDAKNDIDKDGICGDVDNCVNIANTNQADLDGDRIGDICDSQTCGNGAIESGEECDDSNRRNSDGCSDSCVIEEGWICDDKSPTDCQILEQCDDCGVFGGLFCGRDICEDIGECYFVDAPGFINSCNLCKENAVCEEYGTDEQSCESDVCGIGNCVFDNRACKEIEGEMEDEMEEDEVEEEFRLEVESPDRNAVYKNRVALLEFKAENADSCWYELDGERVDSECEVREKLPRLSAGKHRIGIFVRNDIDDAIKGDIREFSIDYTREFLINYGEFYGKGGTTNLDDLDDEELERVSLVLDDGKYGSIEFLESVNLIKDADEIEKEIDIDSNIDISFNRIRVKSDILSALNKKAKLTLRNLEFDDPKILRDGAECKDCDIESYENGVLIFEINGLSVYSAAEKEAEKKEPLNETIKPEEEEIPEEEKPEEERVEKEIVYLGEDISEFDIENGEEILFEIGRRRYSAKFDINEEGVSINIVGNDYFVSSGEVGSVFLGDREVFVSIESFGEGESKLVAALDKSKIKSKEEFINKNEVVIIVIAVLIVVGILIVAITYILSRKKKYGRKLRPKWKYF